ncbi:MAG: beta-N-acetylhexosaminidase [Sphingorhabdus sp.]
MKPVIFGLSGTELSDNERAFFRESEPVGYILFKRNIADRTQVRALTNALRDISGRADVPILIDQEGGRVARMRPPEWPAFPAGGMLDALYDISAMTAIEAARVNAEGLALMLAEVGINVDCLPLLDVRVPETHSAIGDRAMGSDPMRVAALGRAVLDGLQKGGVVGVVKHMPGQGRAVVDSHHELPTVSASKDELQQDFSPFRTLNWAPMGMTGHIVFEAYDHERPATMSPIVIEHVIRGEIGFDNLLISDDLDMKALAGDVPGRAVDCVVAGCDLALNCWGRMDEMIEIANRLPEITQTAQRRLDRAMATIEPVEFATEKLAELLDKRDQLLALASDRADIKLTRAATGAA